MSIRTPLATAFWSTASPLAPSPLADVGRVYCTWTVRPFPAAHVWSIAIALLRRSMPAVRVRDLPSMSMSIRVTP